jgi:perosamine synthetase
MGVLGVFRERTIVSKDDLAIDGGPAVREEPLPPRGLFGAEEKEAVMDLFEESIESGNAFGYHGPEEEAYCEAFAEFMGGGYADAVNSGTSAVYAALRALEIEPFSEVIVSPITDPGGQMPVALMGCVPVVADAAPGSYNTAPEQIEERITPRTSAICVSHVGGEPVDMEGVMALAEEHDLAVVEDASQAHGARLNGKPIGTFGDAAAFSTMSGKHHATGGQGGVVYTRDEDVYWRARRIADRGKPFGTDESRGNVAASLNLNMDELAATVGRVQLEKLPGVVENRRAVAAAIADRIEGLPGIEVPEPVPGGEPSYWFWRIRVDETELTCDKATLCEALSAEGVSLSPSYDFLPHEYAWFQDQRVFGESGYPWQAPEYEGDRDPDFECPNAREAVERCFNLTVYESWGEPEVDDVVAAFEKVTAAYAEEGRPHDDARSMRE